LFSLPPAQNKAEQCLLCWREIYFIFQLPVYVLTVSEITSDSSGVALLLPFAFSVIQIAPTACNLKNDEKNKLKVLL
jgi:hypothetical protein